MNIQKEKVRGTAIGVLFLAIFGTGWSILGINGFSGLWQGDLFVVVTIIFSGLLALSSLLFRTYRKIPSASILVENGIEKNTRTRFRLVFLAEIILILIGIIVCRKVHHENLIPYITLFIVGVHFLPLAALFKLKIYRLTGLSLCIFAIISLFFLPENVTVEENLINLRFVVAGFGSAVTLWGTSVAVFIYGKKLSMG